MAVALETIVKQLEDSGIVAQGKLENFIPPKAHPQSVEELVTELVKQNHLTKFQAQQVSQGKSKALILGNYTILDKIGAGGMGQVFKAEHRRMKRVVAIKMLPPALTKDAAATARFQREVEAAAKLSHPNIVAAHDADEANGAHFLVMEYVEGKDLSATVKKNGPFPVAKAVNYILQAARGLEFAHSEGVVHRDIKPANLLLDKKGTVKILDMGLARIDGGSNAPAQAELTGTGAVMGTVDYMAPEQAMSTRDADARADIYSLGCSLHYLITGKATYGGESVIEKLLAHREKPIPHLRDFSADVSEELEAIFRKMVAKNIEDRYQTMTEVVADLERCSSGQATSLSIQQSTGTNLDKNGLLSFPNLQVTPTIQKTKVTKQVAPAKSSEGKQPPWKNTKVLIAAGAAGFLCLLLGVWVIIRDKDGNEVAKVQVPDGGSVKVQEVKQSSFAKSAKKTEAASNQTPPPKIAGGTSSSALSPVASPAKMNNAPQSRSVFNGRDLTGWFGKPGTWKLENGELVGTLPGKDATFLYATSIYKNFELSFQVRLTGEGANSGVQFRSQLLDAAQFAMTGPQCEIGSTGKTGYGGLWWQSGTRNGVVSAVEPAVYQKLLKPNDFNEMTLKCIGNKVTITLNGTTTVDGEFSIPDEGLLGWQLVSHGSAVEARFRNIRLRDLTVTATPVGFALDFSPAKKSRVIVPNWKYDGKTPLTAECWVVQRKVTESVISILSCTQSGGWSVRCDANGWRFMVHGKDKDYIKVHSDLPPQLGKPTHIAAVFDGRKCSLYIDGRRQKDHQSISPPYAASDVPLLVGAEPGKTRATDTEFFDGTIDEVRISTIVRYSADFTPQARMEPDKDTVVLYHFDEGVGATAKDAASKKRHGQLDGATWVASKIDWDGATSASPVGEGAKVNSPAKKP